MTTGAYIRLIYRLCKLLKIDSLEAMTEKFLSRQSQAIREQAFILVSKYQSYDKILLKNRIVITNRYKF